MNLFLIWLLQHYIIAIFPCGLEESLAHGVANPVHGKARLLFSKHANLQHGDERNLMESGFSRKIRPSAHDSWQLLSCEGKIRSLRRAFTIYAAVSGASKANNAGLINRKQAMQRGLHSTSSASGAVSSACITRPSAERPQPSSCPHSVANALPNRSASPGSSKAVKEWTKTLRVSGSTRHGSRTSPQERVAPAMSRPNVHIEE